MARCPVKGCDWKGKARGLKVHMAKVHDVHPTYDDLHETIAHREQLIARELHETKVCPVIGCGLRVKNVKAHSELFHPEWKLSNGKFVFEVV